MHVFHFGSAQQRLLGVYHSAAPSSRRAAGLVLCHPFGHEYIRAHRAMRTLGSRLADAGIHVLRFDYFACGDSSGNAEEGTLAQWQTDIATAIDELKDMAGLQRVSVLGLRLGAALAAMACSKRSDVNKLVMWAPVVRGDQYLKELTRLQSEWWKSRPRPASSRSETGPAAELFGFPLSAGLREEFDALDLLKVSKWSARQHVVILSQNGDGAELAEHVTQCGKPCTIERTGDDLEWQRTASVHLQWLPGESLNGVAHILEQA